MFQRVPLAMLGEGLVLASPIRDEQQRLLLGAGVPITQELVLGLHKRDVRTVIVADRDYHLIHAFKSRGQAKNTLPSHVNTRSDLESESSRHLDDEINQLGGNQIVASENPFSAGLKRHGATAYDARNMHQMVEYSRQTSGQMQELLGRLGNGEEVADDAVRKLSQEALVRAAEDLDLFVCMGINPSENTSIFAHSTSVATLAVAMGATLGLDEAMLCDLGVGCLVHDAGMLKIDPRLYQSAQVLTDSDFVEIAKHPVISTDLLYQNMKSVPLAVRMIAYQTHERCDGSGYPRGTTGDKIHPLAKIAAVADSYVALVSPRPHRPAMLPYHAMARMLKDVGAGLLDSQAVRALLQTISLFPIGSFVELNNGMVGKTIRANGPSYDRPVVEMWKRTNLSAAPQVVDLLNEPDLKVSKPLTSLR
jgi:HD-GYP domain-containing protein (c-di-GMP phosphodiesterase class II)